MAFSLRTCWLPHVLQNHQSIHAVASCHLFENVCGTYCNHTHIEHVQLQCMVMVEEFQPLFFCEFWSEKCLHCHTMGSLRICDVLYYLEWISVLHLYVQVYLHVLIYWNLLLVFSLLLVFAFSIQVNYLMVESVDFHSMLIFVWVVLFLLVILK